MGALDLTILIPTYNRPHKVSNLLLQLETILFQTKNISFEIVISDNHSKPRVEIPESEFLKKVSRIVIPPEHLDTAEENLLFALNFARGRYTWILGDDDEPILSGVLKLLTYVENDEYDLMIFNSLGFDPVNKAWNISRMKTEKFVEQVKLRNFIMKAGFWSLPAGFSTLIFRTSDFDSSFMNNLHASNLKIYSHVTTLLQSFHSKSFAAIAFPLVKYASNSFDDESPLGIEKSDHWVSYARRNDVFYRYPWTHSFVQQIKILEVKGIFSRRDLFLTLDQGHLGNRFAIFDSILGFVIDQIIYEYDNPNESKIRTEEIKFICDFCSGIDDGIDEIIKQLLSLPRNHNSIIKFKQAREELFSEDHQMERRFFLHFAGGKIYVTPYGYHWTPIEIDININFSSHSNSDFGVSSDNLESLQEMIPEWKKQHALIELYRLEKINVSGLNSLIQKNDKLFRKIPRFIRKRF